MKAKKILAAIAAGVMVLCAMSFTALADENVISVTAENAQAVLDGAEGDITGKTIHFTESIDEVLDLARTTAYEGSGTVYYNYHQTTGLDSEPTSWSADIASVMNSHSRYYRTLKDVTFTADEGVTLAGFRFAAGHVASSGYDYVRGVELTSGVTYYDYRSLENITFSGLTITGKANFYLYLEGSTVSGITFDSCKFTGTTGDMEDTGFAAVKMNADSQYFSNVTIKNCTINNYFQGVYIQGVDGAVIENNTIDTTTHNAISLQSSVSNYTKGTVSVQENYITNVTDRAIRLQVIDGANIAINNNVMVNCGDDAGELIKATSVTNATIDLENNYWDGKALSTAVKELELPESVGIVGGTFTADVSNYVAYGYSVVNGTVTEGSGESASVWTTDIDAGSYVDGGTTYGMMRFLFAADVEGVTSSGIMYIKGNDPTKQVGDRVTGTSNAFYGDIVGIEEGTEGTYYAVAYITTAEGTIWSAPLPCTINWTKQFTNYGGAQ